MVPLRVIFMGTPDFSIPPLNAIHAQADEFKVVGVYTQPDRPAGRGKKMQFSAVKKRALELDLAVHQPEKLSNPGEFEKLEALKPDVIVVVAYGQILRQNVLDLPKLGCVNIHGSLLPKWRGAAPIQWAVLNGDSSSGVTTMLMVKRLDAGDMLLKGETDLTEDETSASLYERLSVRGAELILPTLRGLREGSLTPIPQDESEMTLAPKLTKEMQWLDSNRNTQELDCQVRGLFPWPGASIRLEDGKRLKVLEAKPHPDIEGNPGQIFEKFGMVLWGTSGGSLELKTVQLEGKKPMAGPELLNGLLRKK